MLCIEPVNGIDEWFVICKNVKIGVVEMMLKMFHRQDSGQKLLTKLLCLRSQGDKEQEKEQIGY